MTALRYKSEPPSVSGNEERKMNRIDELANGIRCITCGCVIPQDEQNGEPQKCSMCIEEDWGEPI